MPQHADKAALLYFYADIVQGLGLLHRLSVFIRAHIVKRQMQCINNLQFSVLTSVLLPAVGDAARLQYHRSIPARGAKNKAQCKPSLRCALWIQCTHFPVASSVKPLMLVFFAILPLS